MPFKHNESVRHHIKKSQYKVTSVSAYNTALRRRGDITLWFTADAIADWCPAKTGRRGRPREYSPAVIETAAFIRQTFRYPSVNPHIALKIVPKHNVFVKKHISRFD